jgi:hypothetical protein
MSRAPCRDFGATIAPLTIARRTCRCGVSPSRTRSLQRRPTASETRSPVAASNSKNGRHLAGTSSSSRTSSARVRKRRSRIDHARPARRRGRTMCCAGLASSKPSATAASNAKRSGVSQLADADLAVEVRQREVHQQSPVLAARAGTHAVAATARVAIKPRQAELVQGRAAPPRTRLAVALQLDHASVGHRVGRLLALAAVDAVHHDQLRPTPVDARYGGRLEWQHHQCCPVATAVATSGRSPTAKNPLPERNR